MESFLKLQLLAIVQGLTEFLPVSSSGHLALLKHWLGVEGGEGPVLELLLHGGTLLAILAFYRERLLDLLAGLLRREKETWHYAAMVVLCCVPAGLLYLAAHDFLEQAFQSPRAIGAFLVLTSAILFSLKKLPDAPPGGTTEEGTAAPGWRQALGIGFAQAMAILPGVSRSGSTYTAARWLKVPGKEAFDFSFLVSVPLILGSILLKAKELHSMATQGENALSLACATLLAALVGYVALAALAKLHFRGKIWLFAPYCLALGLLALLLA